MASLLDAMLLPHRAMSRYFARERRCDIGFFEFRERWLYSYHEPSCPCRTYLPFTDLTETPGYRP